MSGGFPALPPLPQAELYSLTGENIYETIRDNETTLHEEDRSKKCNEPLAPGNPISRKHDPVISESTNSTIPTNNSSISAVHHASALVTPRDIKQITDESGYLNPTQENEPDFFNVPSALSTEGKCLTHQHLNPPQGGNEVHLSEGLTDPKHNDQELVESRELENVMADDWHLVPREERQNADTPNALSDNTGIRCNKLRNDLASSWDEGNSAIKERVYYSLDDDSSEERKYYDVGSAKASQGPLTKGNSKIGPTSKQESVDDQGYLVPGVEEFPRLVTSVEPLRPNKETTCFVPYFPATSDKTTTKSTFPTVDNDTEDDEVRHTYFGLDDFSEDGDPQCLGINDGQKFEIGHDDNCVSGSKLTNRKDHGTGDSINSIQHLIDELGYLILNDEESETIRSESLHLIDDTGYLLPNVKDHKVARDTSSSSFVRDEGDNGNVDIVHSYFGFKDRLGGDEHSPECGGEPGVERQLETENAHSPPGATLNEGAGTTKIQHSYFGFRDAVGEDNDYQSEILLGNDEVKVQEKGGQTSSLSLMALQGNNNSLSNDHNCGGREKDETEKSCIPSSLLADRDTDYDEIIHSYFGFNDALEEKRPKHSNEQNDCVEDQGKISSSSSPCRKDKHGDIHPGPSDMGRYRLHESIDSHVSIQSSDGSGSPSFHHTYLDFNDLQEQQGRDTSDGSDSPSFQHTYLDCNDLQEQQSKETLHNYEMVEERT